MKNLVMSLAVMAFTACNANAGQSSSNLNQNPTDTMSQPTASAPQPGDVKVLVSTSEGDFEVLLYGDTPKHQQNFVKLVNEGYYNGTLFHRVIKDFMVQAGDPDSKGAQPGARLGAGGPGYQIDAEFVYPKHFHKKGALAAARQGDEVNPERKSSGSQFYVVTGKKYTPAQLEQIEARMRQDAIGQEFYKLANARRDEIMKMQQEGDQKGLTDLQDELVTRAEGMVPEIKLTPEQVEAYTTVGGTPFLDNQYTVFGEVIKGLDVVDRIQAVETAPGDRPVKDVVINSMKIID